MRIAVDHRTQYRFTAPQRRLVQLLRLTPGDTMHQTVVNWRIDVSCDARMRETRDGFGNIVTMLYVDGPVDEIEIAVAGEVLLTGSDGIVRGPEEPLPPMVYRRNTRLTQIDDKIAARVAALGDPSTHPLDWLHRLNADLSRDAPVERAREAAHRFLAAARHAGFPARHVSGYSLAACAERARARPHDWAEAYVDGLGWVAFDPAFGISPDTDHVRVAVGLDATDAAPIAGSRLGQGEERLDVEVAVNRLGGAQD